MHGEHFRKNCVGRNRGVGLWRLNQRLSTLDSGGWEEFVLAEGGDDDSGVSLIRISTNLECRMPSLQPSTQSSARSQIIDG